MHGREASSQGISMLPKTMILLALAVTCGLGVVFISSRPLAHYGPPEEQERVVVLVARKKLDTGCTIKDPKDFFAEKAVIKGEEPKNAVTKLDDLKDRVVKHSLREGDIVCGSDLLRDHDSGSIASLMIPKGHRAVRIRAQWTGSILPGSRVDLIATLRHGPDKSVSHAVLQNVLVLAMDQQTGDRNCIPGVTVALTPEDVPRATLALEFGPLNLVACSHR
jgi:Flp pilus assembly protein CpaB